MLEVVRLTNGGAGRRTQHGVLGISFNCHIDRVREAGFNHVTMPLPQLSHSSQVPGLGCRLLPQAFDDQTLVSLKVQVAGTIS